MSHNFLKIAAGISLVAIPLFLFKDQITSIFKAGLTDLNSSLNYAQDRLGASGGIDTGNNTEVF